MISNVGMDSPPNLLLSILYCAFYLAPECTQPSSLESRTHLWRDPAQVDGPSSISNGC